MDASMETDVEAGDGWLPLAGLDPETATFPSRVRLGSEGIVVFRTKTGFRGTDRVCPHMKASMLNAEVTADGTMVRCMLHVFTFRLSDGKGVNCPGFKLRLFEIKQVGARLYGRPAN
jgi:nitrite reductase/ring-hydroxylating ferredoxin subunit